MPKEKLLAEPINVAGASIFNVKGDCILALRDKTLGVVTFPSGRLETGDSPKNPDTAKRLLGQLIVGLIISDPDLLGKSQIFEGDDAGMTCAYVCEADESVPVASANDELEAVWIALTDIEHKELSAWDKYLLDAGISHLADRNAETRAWPLAQPVVALA